jgi:hypothetical protein
MWATNYSLHKAINLTAGLMMRCQVQESSVAALQLDRGTEDDPCDYHRDHPPPLIRGITQKTAARGPSPSGDGGFAAPAR